MRIIQQFKMDLNRESSTIPLILDPLSTKIHYYEQFLGVLGTKIDQLNSIKGPSSDRNSMLGKRPHSFSEDNIKVDFR